MAPEIFMSDSHLSFLQVEKNSNTGKMGILDMMNSSIRSPKTAKNQCWNEGKTRAWHLALWSTIGL